MAYMSEEEEEEREGREAVTVLSGLLNGLCLVLRCDRHEVGAGKFMRLTKTQPRPTKNRQKDNSVFPRLAARCFRWHRFVHHRPLASTHTIPPFFFYTPLAMLSQAFPRFASRASARVTPLGKVSRSHRESHSET